MPRTGEGTLTPLVPLSPRIRVRGRFRAYKGEGERRTGEKEGMDSRSESGMTEGRLGMVGGLNQDPTAVYGDDLARDHGREVAGEEEGCADEVLSLDHSSGGDFRYCRGQSLGV